MRPVVTVSVSILPITLSRRVCSGILQTFDALYTLKLSSLTAKYAFVSDLGDYCLLETTCLGMD